MSSGPPARPDDGAGLEIRADAGAWRHGSGRANRLGRVLRKLFGSVALAVAAVTVLTGCGQTPVKMGAAAIVADERITTAEVQDAVRSFRQAQERSQIPPSQLRLPDPQSLPRSELMLLVRFHIVEAAARSEGIEVSDSEVEAFITEQGNREQLELRGLIGGIPPNYLRDAVREALIRERLAQRVAPDAEAAQASRQVQEYLTGFASDLAVTVSPRYGQFDPETLAVAPAEGTRLSRPETPAAEAS